MVPKVRNICVALTQVVWRVPKKLQRWARSPRVHHHLFIILVIGYITYYCWQEEELNEDFDLIIRNAETKLREQLELDKGHGCEMPALDPFSEQATRFDKHLPKVVCSGQDWVKCYHAECKVSEDILNSYEDIVCTYRDILYQNDFLYTYGEPVEVSGAKVYRLERSDHVKVACSGVQKESIVKILRSRWSGNAAGYRSAVSLRPPPKGREDTINILMFGFDSTARIGFIRRMPKSYKYLTEELQATVLKSYNIVGDGTKGALFPMLTGKNMYELPNTRVKKGNTRTCDEYPLLFYKLRDDGYRTAFFEDRPEIGAFQYWVNGFRHQPTDHYLRAFFQDRSNFGNRYCVGDTPQYKLMMNLTSQFMHLDGKKFIFTFLVDITHEDFNVISTADEDFLDFLKRFKSEGHLNNTLLVTMSDHGPRYSARTTPQSRMEERLPLMAFVLPEKLKSQKPGALGSLQGNVDTLTTPYDIHSTLLDAVGLREYWNDYKVPGAAHTRGMTIFEPIPRNRSCSEAGVEAHWCACLSWRPVSHLEPLYRRAGEALVDFINGLTKPAGPLCSPRTLSNITWLMQQDVNSELFKLEKRTYQVKITVGPGEGDYEATMTYSVELNKFEIDITDISRTNRYGDESKCILTTYAYLSPYCYCRDHGARTSRGK